MSNNIAVVGGGAAGLLAAGIAARQGAQVTLFEKNPRIGRKLIITGKGRCNVTNNCDEQTVLANIPRNPRFLYSALHAFPPAGVIAFFEELGVPMKTERGGRVFPVSDQSVDVVDALYRFVTDGGVQLVHAPVSAILTEAKADVTRVTGVTAGGRSYTADRVILATGGASYSLTGSTGDGYRIAEALGHTVISPQPSLVPLTAQGDVCRALMGLSLRNVALTVYENDKKCYSDFGEMLFTHFGVSGPLVLSASAHMRRWSECTYRMEINLKPALDDDVLDRRLLSDFEKYKNSDFINALGDLLPRKLIPVMVEAAGIDPRAKVNTVTRVQRLRLLTLLHAFPIALSGTRPIAEAIVTTGGISVREVSPKSMESRSCAGLYFAGEVLDIDAYTGGFNLQIAWSTGFLAGMASSADADLLQTDRDVLCTDDKQAPKESTKGKKRDKLPTVAIDGPSGAGKSTIARAVAAAMGLLYVDTGALYRTIGLAANRAGIAGDDAQGTIALLPTLQVALTYKERAQRVILNGEDVTACLRTPEITQTASQISCIPEVRAFLLELQRGMAKRGGVIMDGRDIGTVILPQADIKIFLTASAEQRAQRRYRELCAKGEAVTLEQVLESMRQRDEQDECRAAAPLKQADDAVLVDTSTLDLTQSIAFIRDLIENN